MPQLYPQPVSSTIGVTIRAGAGLFGGGAVALDQSITLSTETTRQQYTLTPVPDGSNGTFSIQGPVPSGYYDLFVNGLLQSVSAYSSSGSKVLFQTPPDSLAVLTVAFAQPEDSRQQTLLTPVADGTTTSFTFPGSLPDAGYVDVYSSDGHMLIAGSDYELSRVSGNWTVVFYTAPAANQTPMAVFATTGFEDRNQYELAPTADGTTTRFRIVGGAPEASVDAFEAGVLRPDAVVNLANGVWVVDFSTAPALNATLVVVF